MTNTDFIRGELERLLSLEEMVNLASDALGLAPEHLGGATAKASFAKALTRTCAEQGSLLALVDALVTTRLDADPRLRSEAAPPSPDLKAGESVGEYIIVRSIATGPNAVIYEANRKGQRALVKVFARELQGTRGLERLLTHTRLLAKVAHPNLLNVLEVARTDDRSLVAYAFPDGATPLSGQLTRMGAMSWAQVRPIVREVLEAITAVHRARLLHGGIKAENILLMPQAGRQVALLMDPGAHRLIRSSFGSGLSSSSTVKSLSPEQLRGGAGDVRSDLFSVGQLVYEMLTGKAPFAAQSAADQAALVLTQSPKHPAAAAPKSLVPPEVDELCMRLLSRDPAARPKDAGAAIAALEVLSSPPSLRPSAMDAGTTAAAIQALLAAPQNTDCALALEASVSKGADARKVAEAFEEAAIDAPQTVKAGLLTRAARIYETNLGEPKKAEQILAALVEANPADDILEVALEEIRKSLGMYEEVIELLLKRSERATDPHERARALNQIGQLYWHELKSTEEAVVAFAEALAQAPESSEFAMDLEHCAGSDAKLWTEALQALTEATKTDRPAEERVILLVRIGRWYATRGSRIDLAVAAFQAVLSLDGTNEDALGGMADVYRKSQQWAELATVLVARADRTASPALARDLRAQAAELFETKLNDGSRAKDLYEAVLADDPAHPLAALGFGRILRSKEDFSGLYTVLDNRAREASGEALLSIHLEAAEIAEDRLSDLASASRHYHKALELDPRSLTALRGLDRIYSRTGDFTKLLENLHLQLGLSSTPKQRIGVLERIASIHDEEFLDHARAAEAHEKVLEIDQAHSGALASLGRHYRALDRWEDTAKLYERRLSLCTDNAERVELLLGLGRVLLDQCGSPERARHALERVLEIDDAHRGALETLAGVRAAMGDATAALSAVESLAAKASSPESKAELWLRAAKILEDKGDRDGAIERYKAALDAQPGNAVATGALRSAYLAKGDAASAVELLARAAERAEGNLAKSRLFGDMALLLRDRLREPERAKDAASKALALDPTSIQGQLILGDIAFEAGRFIEASRHYESLAGRADLIELEHRAPMLMRYIEGLERAGSTEKAKSIVESLLRLSPDDPSALSRAARVYLDSGDAQRAADIYSDLLTRFRSKLPVHERAQVLLHQGEAKIALGDTAGAATPLREAADLLPDSPAPLAALARLHAAKNDHAEVLRIWTKQLERVEGPSKTELLLQMAELAESKLKDTGRAGKFLISALDSSPDDRRVLSHLMRIYSEGKDWPRLVEVVMRLSEKVDDKRQRAKYLHTAAVVTFKEMKDLSKAAALYQEVLSLDPSLDRALIEAEEIGVQRKDHHGLEQLYRADIEHATDRGDTERLLRTLEKLAGLYEGPLNSIIDAIDALEAAQSLDPSSSAREERLAGLYAKDPERFLDKAVAAQMPLLQRNPYRPEPYRLLRKLYTDAKRADAVWCVCQALTTIKHAAPDEEKFFKRLRLETAIPAADRLSNDDWLNHLLHPDLDPALLAVLSIIEPSVIQYNGQPLTALGLSQDLQVDVANHPYPMPQTLNFASIVLGFDGAPPTYENPQDAGGVSFVHATVPSISLGAAALAAELPPQAAAFIGARHIAFYRPGLYLRHLVPTVAALRAWLFAAIKVGHPSFPIPAELNDPVNANAERLKPRLVGQTRDLLISNVTKLLQAGTIDLKRYLIAVDHTADRAGLLISGDLEMAWEMVKASDPSASAASQGDRLKDLLLFSVSESYLSLRKKLKVEVG